MDISYLEGYGDDAHDDVRGGARDDVHDVHDDDQTHDETAFF